MSIIIGITISLVSGESSSGAPEFAPGTAELVWTGNAPSLTDMVEITEHDEQAALLLIGGHGWA